MAKITKEMIARILAHVGGAANVAQAGNCMTRLRLTLRDESLADSAAIRQIDGVMGVIVSDEQFQVVLGPGKAQTAAEMMNGLLAVMFGVHQGFVPVYFALVDAQGF
ncbi:PTS transporter subunit EIIB, partial [Klebsiella pneumoniae]|nr:PTS transporter subunit EIIB [Klebsiella pneumoniae]